MKFEFKAFDNEGKKVEGIIEAQNKDDALKILQNKNLLVTRLIEKKIDFTPSLILKPSKKEIYLFTRQLFYLVSSKTPLDESVKVLSEITKNSYFKEILIQIYNDLVAGLPFSYSLSKFSDVFDSYFIGMVRIGEASGSLDETLKYLSDHIENQIRLKGKLIQALIYPVFVLVLFLGIMIALFYLVIPQITKIFVENNIPIPTITKTFQTISDALTKNFIVILIIIGFLIYYLPRYFRSRDGKVIYFSLISNLPIIGPVVQNIYAAQFLESIYYLSKGGVPIIEALTIIKTSIDHPLYEEAIDSVIEEVKRGRPLSSSLQKFPHLFPHIMVETLSIAEKTGQLVETSFTILQFYNQTIETQLTNMGEALQPILIFILGGGLGLLEASLLVPLMSLTKYIRTF